MTLRTCGTPDEVPDCVKSSVFTEVELAHDWTLQPPLAAYLDIHRSISVCSWCGASSWTRLGLRLPGQVPQSILSQYQAGEEYAGNALLRAFLTCPDGTRVYWRSEGDGAMEICSSTLYSRICRKCGYPTEIIRTRMTFTAPGAPTR